MLCDIELRLLKLLLGLFSFSEYIPYSCSGRLFDPGGTRPIFERCLGSTDCLSGVEGVATEGKAFEKSEDIEADGPIELDAGVPGVGAMSSSIFLRIGSFCKETPACIHFPDLINSSCFFLQRMQTQMTLFDRNVTLPPHLAQQRTLQ